MAPSRPAAIEALVVDAIESAALPAPLEEQAFAVVGKAFAHYRGYPAWPIAELPYRTLVALGGDEELAETLAAAAVFFFCASDVIDDAQDDELAAIPGWRGTWQEAVNAGNLLLFLSQQAIAQAPAAAEVRARWQGMFAAAGVRLAAGQSLDFAARPDAAMSEAQAIGVARAKAGAAWANLASLAPEWAGRDTRPWAAFGEALGTLYQVFSDVWPYVAEGPHQDLAEGKLTLPLLHAREADPAIAELFQDGRLLDAAGQEALRARVAASGAIIYAALRVEVLKKEAQDSLAALGCPEAEASLAPLLELPPLQDPLRPGV